MTSRRHVEAELVLLAEGSLPPRVIVCERSGQWAVALRAAVGHVFNVPGTMQSCPVGHVSNVRGTMQSCPTYVPRPGSPRVCETRSLAECRQELARRPSSFVVAELTPSIVDGLVDLLAGLPRQFPLAAVAVVAERSLADHEPLVREAGAVHFVASPRETDALARLACRHLERAASPRRSVGETILAGLPWASPEDR